ncbi:hypothetical protein ACJMK2_011208 [Sinanodonta woodiana]|uniref:NACHT domain-containing protein n=1 Tax=Sinanodonta woodiana TaxID=1069815 RepID=A0ABD3V5L8_SINWO
MPISIFSTDEQVPLDEFCVDIVIKLQTEYFCGSKKPKAYLSSYNQIFADGKKKRIILTGQAGSGKSTFCRRLISIWCKSEQRRKLESPDKTRNILQKRPDAISDEEALLQFSLVFYVYAPDLSTETKLIDYLCNECKNSETDNTNKLTQIFKEQPDKILVILDGMDEISDTAPTFVSKILKRKLYPRITVLMAMRPFRISELGLKTENDLLLETGGLSRTNALTFVKKIMDLNKSQMPTKTLSLSPEEEEVFVTFKNVPLLLLFLTHLWCQDQSLPTRRRDLYRQILDCFIKKCLIRTENTYIPDIREHDNMTKRKYMFCKLYLDSACMAAYHFLLVEKTGQIPEEKLMSELGDNSKFKLRALLDCGILSKSDAFSTLQRCVSIKFLHFSIQEYLASMYLVNNEDAFQTFLASFNSLNTIHKNKQLVIFICGLDEQKGHLTFVKICEVCDNDPLVIQFRQGMDDDGEIKYSLESLNLMYKECLKEMDSQGIIEIPDIVSLEDKWYVTEMSRIRSSNSKSLYLCCVELNRDDALDMRSMTNLIFLSLCGVIMSETCSRSLCNSISCCTQMKTLKLEALTLHDHILDLRSLTNLITLILVDIGTSGKKCVCSGISDCTNLERLKLKLIPLDDYVNDVSRMTNLTCITLDNVTMSLNCSKSMCASISNCANLRMLQLEGIQLHDGILNLSRLTQLTSLSLKKVSMSDKCSESLCNSISCCTQMKTLKLEALTLHDHILDLRSLTNLITLILVDIGTPEKKCLCSGISDCTNLERLKLKLIPLDDYVNDVSRMTNLTCLTLDNVTMSPNCSKSMCASISNCANLRMLQLEGIQLHDGILNLSRLTKLTSLTLNKVEISDECNIEMFGNISSCTQLERLHLAFISVKNGIPDLSRVKDLEHLKVCDLYNASNLYKNV